MDEQNNRQPQKLGRQAPLNQRGSIDGVKARQPESDDQPTPNPESPDEQQTSEQNPEQAPEQEPPKENQPQETEDYSKPKKKINLFAIFLAVVIMIGLSAVAIYVGTQENSNEPEVVQPAPTNSNSAPPAGTGENDTNQLEVNQPSNQSDATNDDDSANDTTTPDDEVSNDVPANEGSVDDEPGL